MELKTITFDRHSYEEDRDLFFRAKARQKQVEEDKSMWDKLECMKFFILFLFVVATSIVSAKTYYPRKIVMEEGTGSWCGWCVRGIETIERMRTKYPDNFIAIALHTGDKMSNPENYSDLVIVKK